MSVPQAGQRLYWAWYSTTNGSGGGGASKTWRRCVFSTGANERSASHPAQAAGARGISSSGSSTCRSVFVVEPFCPPGLRPAEVREEPPSGRRPTGSDDGGLPLVFES